MKLKNLVRNLNKVKVIGSLDKEIKELSSDSNSVQAGTLFICLKGNAYDGHNFVKQVETYGAVAIITEREVVTSLTQIIVTDTRVAMSILASNFYNNPDKKIKIIGVTGTNGKTTTTHLIKKVLDESDINCGVIGTLGVYYNDVFIEPTLTTPDPILLYKILSDMVISGVEVVAMEVSAHALYYDKVVGLKFEVGVLTNFTQDHLDFFENMREYKTAKCKLFERCDCKFLIVNSDDELGVEILNKNDKVISYGIENPADVFAVNILEKKDCTKFILNLFDVILNIDLKLSGNFNVYNAMATATASALVGAHTFDIERGLNNTTTVSGRFEKVYDKEFSVFIDYAHTPDGLLKTLKTAKKFCKNKLICVFGCGGNRDKGKREIMGEISGNIADFTVITTDNPRYEEPMDIICEIERGVLKVTKNYVLVQDRFEAIKYALDYAKKGDVIVVAGKGSEQYQEILGIKHNFNDKDIINEILGDKNCLN